MDDSRHLGTATSARTAIHANFFVFTTRNQTILRLLMRVCSHLTDWLDASGNPQRTSWVCACGQRWGRQCRSAKVSRAILLHFSSTHAWFMQKTWICTNCPHFAPRDLARFIFQVQKTQHSFPNLHTQSYLLVKIHWREYILCTPCMCWPNHPRNLFLQRMCASSCACELPDGTWKLARMQVGHPTDVWLPC